MGSLHMNASRPPMLIKTDPHCNELGADIRWATCKHLLHAGSRRWPPIAELGLRKVFAWEGRNGNEELLVVHGTGPDVAMKRFRPRISFVDDGGGRYLLMIHLGVDAGPRSFRAPEQALLAFHGSPRSHGSHTSSATKTNPATGPKGWRRRCADVSEENDHTRRSLACTRLSGTGQAAVSRAST